MGFEFVPVLPQHHIILNTRYYFIVDKLNGCELSLIKNENKSMQHDDLLSCCDRKKLLTSTPLDLADSADDGSRHGQIIQGKEGFHYK